eukprot:4473702-Pyramimonas_sp.AAC.1
MAALGTNVLERPPIGMTALGISVNGRQSEWSHWEYSSTTAKRNGRIGNIPAGILGLARSYAPATYARSTALQEYPGWDVFRPGMLFFFGTGMSRRTKLSGSRSLLAGPGGPKPLDRAKKIAIQYWVALLFPTVSDRIAIIFARSSGSRYLLAGSGGPKPLDRAKKIVIRYRVALLLLVTLYFLKAYEVCSRPSSD